MGKRGNPNIREVSKATQFKPGQSGNPRGPGKAVSITRLVRAELMKPATEGSSVTKGDLVAAKIVSMAQDGDRVIAPLVWRYMDGDPKAAADMTLRELALQLAEKLGLDADALMATFERETGAA